MPPKPNKNAPHGTIFLGKDEATYGKSGIGTIPYDPEIECGGPVGTKGRRCAYPPTEERTGGLDLIGGDGRDLHVAIASYRDPLCPKTLYNLFSKAKHPEKVHVRVLQQNDPEVDTDCFVGYCELMAKDNDRDAQNEEDAVKNCPYKDQVFIHNIHASEAAGPTWARGLLSQDIEDAYNEGKLKPQDHCLSIDSHMDFEPEWDSGLITMFDQTQNEYAVLSTYVTDVEALGKDSRNVPHLCMVKFTSNVRTHATKACNNLSKPKLTNAIWGAGLSFSKCHAELKVMVDPHTPHIFDGEEFNKAARFWTHGYDIYTPNRIFVLHDYHKSQSNPITTGWGKNPTIHGTFKDSNRRLKTMIDVPGGETDPNLVSRMKKSKFGLGDRRSLDQLIEFSGIDLRHGKVTIDGKNRCGNIRWVPFDEHPKGVNYIPKFEEGTEDPLELPYDRTSVWYDSKDDDDREVGGEEEDLGKKHEALFKELQEMDAEDGEYEDLGKKHDALNKELEEMEVEEIENEDLGKKHAALKEELQQIEESESESEDSKKKLLHQIKLDNPGDDDAQPFDHEISKEIVKSDKENEWSNSNTVPQEEQKNNLFSTKLESEKENFLRKPLEGRFFSGTKVIKGFLVDHSIVKSTDQHGFQNLPGLVQGSVALLIIGVLISIKLTAGKGRNLLPKVRTV